MSRRAALAALAGSAVVVAILLLRGHDAYKVTFRFENAAQLVKGAAVQVGGRRIGLVDDISLADDRTAEVTAHIDDERIAPLPAGTQAVLRSGSLTGVANRYVDLQLPGGPTRATLPSGSVIGTDRTITNIDLDQLFNTFDTRTRRGLGKVVRGFGRTYAGQAGEANAGWRYLNPSLVASRRLFDRLSADRLQLERFVQANAGLMHHLAGRRDQLATIVDRLAVATGAIGSRRRELAQAIGVMPAFMARTTSTLAKVRSTVDDLDPVVRESDPVVRRLPGLLTDLRSLARRSRVPARALAGAIAQPGSSNDLVDLLRAAPALARVAAGPVQSGGKQRDGAFPATAEALREQTPHVAFLRPYSVDLTGWLDDFAHAGVYDANGRVGRVALTAPAFALINNLLTPVPGELRGQVFKSVAAVGQRDRCPGAADRRSADGSRPWRPSPDFACDPSQVLPGG
jgi:phospholipid/cholesterol/gamma-HCH transport system substrate-binding protein